MIKEKIFKEIKDEMKKNGSWGERAHFQCFADNVLTYKIENDNIVTGLNIIADDIFFSDEIPIEIFRKKRIVFLEYSVYIRNGNKLERINSKCYRPVAELGLN